MFSKLKGYSKGLIFISTGILSSYFGFVGMIFPLILLYFINPTFYQFLVDRLIASWACIPMMILDLFGTKVFVYSNEERLNEKAIIIMNHKNDLDWFYYMYLSLRHQNLNSLKIALKHELKHIFGAGWSIQASPFLFLERNWSKDKTKITKYFDHFDSLKYPLQLLLFCEGTNFTPYSKQRSDKYAADNNLPFYKYVLHPRATGYSFMMNEMTSNSNPLIDGVYNTIIAYRGRECFGFWDIISGNFQEEVHIYIEYFQIGQLPKTIKKHEEWLQEQWKKKEDSLENFYTNGEFIGSPKLISSHTNRLVLILRSFVVILGAALSFYIFLISKAYRYYYLFVSILVMNLGYTIGLDNLIIGNWSIFGKERLL